MKRYYVSNNSDLITEYPAKVVYSPSGVVSLIQGVSVMEEHELFRKPDLFRLHPSIAEAAIEKWTTQ